MYKIYSPRSESFNFPLQFFFIIKETFLALLITVMKLQNDSKPTKNK